MYVSFCLISSREKLREEREVNQQFFLKLVHPHKTPFLFVLQVFIFSSMHIFCSGNLTYEVDTLMNWEAKELRVKREYTDMCIEQKN